MRKVMFLLFICLASCSWNQLGTAVSKVDYVAIAQSRLEAHDLTFGGIGGSGENSSHTHFVSERTLVFTGNEDDADTFFSDFRGLCKNVIVDAERYRMPSPYSRSFGLCAGKNWFPQVPKSVVRGRERMTGILYLSASTISFKVTKVPCTLTSRRRPTDSSFVVSLLK